MADIYTQAGEELVIDCIDPNEAALPTDWFIGWGTGSTTAVKGDTTIETEGAETRLAGAVTQPSVDILQIVATLTSLSIQTIANAGVLSLVTGGILLLHSDFTGIVLAIGDKIEFTFTLEQT